MPLPINLLRTGKGLIQLDPHPQLLDKFRRNARRILSDERVETIINIVNDLENLKNVGEVISMVSKQSEYAS